MRKCPEGRIKYGDKLMTELRLQHGIGFKKFSRTSVPDFGVLLMLVGARICLVDTH
jgi:hypothetical protein